MAETVAIDLVVNGLSMIKELSQALRDLRDAARGVGKVGEGIDKVGQGANKAKGAVKGFGDEQRRVNADLDKAYAGFLKANEQAAKYASSVARLQIAQKNLAGAQKTLENGLDRVNASSATGIRLQTELARVKDRIAKDAARPTGLLAALSSGFAREAGESIGQAGQIFTSFISGPLTALGERAVQSAVQLEAARQRLQSVAGSAAEASRQFATLQELAKLPGIDLPGAVNAAASLEALGFTFKETGRIIKEFSNVIALGGGTAENFNGVITQLQQMSAASKVLGQDLKPIIQQAPLIGKAIKDAFGTVNTEEIQKLGIAPRKFIEIVLQSLEKLTRAPLTFQERIANLSQAVDKALEPLGRVILDTIVPALEKLAPTIQSVADGFAGLPGPIRLAVVALLGLTAAVGPTLSIIGGLVQGLQIIQIGRLISVATELGKTATAATTAGAAATVAARQFLGLEVAATATTASFGPLGIALIAIGATLGLAALAWANYKSKTEEALEVTEKQIPNTAANISALNASIKALKERTVTTESLSTAISLLDPAEQAYTTTLTNQEDKIKRVSEELEKKRVIEERLAEIELSKVAAGLDETAKKYAQQAVEVKLLGDAYDEAVKQQDAYNNLSKETKDALFAVGSEFSDAGLNAGKLGDELQKQQKQLAESKANIEKFALGVLRAKGSQEAALATLEKFRQTGVLSNAAYQAAAGIVNNFAKEIGAAGVTAATVEERIRTLTETVDKLSLASRRSEIKGIIEKAVIEAAGNAEKAFKRLGEGTLPGLVKDLKTFEKGVSDVESKFGLDRTKKVSKVPKFSDKSFQDSINRQQEALVSFEKAKDELSITRARIRDEAETRIIEQQLEDRKISLKEFYDRKQKLDDAVAQSIQTNIEKELVLERIRLIDIEAQKRARLAGAKNQVDIEKINNEFGAKEIEQNTKIINLTNKGAQAERDAAREREKNLDNFKKGTKEIEKELTALAKSQLENTAKGFGEIVKARLDAIKSKQDLAQSDLATETQRIQNLVDRGLVNERAAREAILAIERQKKTVIEERLKEELRIAKLLPEGVDKEKALADIRQRQVEADRLGVETIFADVRKGLNEDLQGAFDEFIASGIGSLEGIRDLALGIVNSFRNAANKFLSEFIQKRIVDPLVNNVFGALFGGKTIDPNLAANTAATTANTGAVTALTGAILSKSITGSATGSDSALSDLFGGDDEGLFGGGGETAATSDKSKNPLSGIFDKIGGAIKGFASSIAGVAGKIGGGLRNILGSIVSFAGSIFGSIFGGKVKGFEGGSYTGDGPTNQVAGVVHGKEFVFDAKATRRIGPGTLEALRSGLVDFGSMLNTRILASVAARSPRQGFLTGGYAAQPSPSLGSNTTNIKNVIVDDRRQALGEIASADGVKTLLTVFGKNRSAFNAALQGA